MKQLWRDIAELAGFSLDEDQLDLLETYREWLRTEAIPAGGLGPEEESKLDERHIADSLLFAWPFVDAPQTTVDLGTGVGLPGIPLAILWRQTRFCLVDRSGRRVDLTKRACRVLKLENVEVIISDLTRMTDRFPAVVSRATIPPTPLAEIAENLLLPGGLAVVGGSWTAEPRESRWETIEIPAKMLDRTVWLLIMRRE